MNRFLLFCGMVCISLLLSACGGSKNENDAPNTPEPEQPPIAFSLTLTDIEVRRSSNAESIAVDIDGINSGTLLLHNPASAAP